MHEQVVNANEDRETLQQLGRACAEIVHDTRNELNALKLYATFLFKRSQKNNWLPDEQETLAKLFDGLERSAAALGMLSRYSRPIQLSRRSGTDLREIVQSLALNQGLEHLVTVHFDESISDESETTLFSGSFDPALLQEALMAITLSVLQQACPRNSSGIKIRLGKESTKSITQAVVEWESAGFKTSELLHSAVGIAGVRISLAAKIVAAHDGTLAARSESLGVTLPLTS